MPGRNPREAVDAFLEPLKDTISCVARAKITLSHDGRGGTGKIHGLTVNNDMPVKLTCRPVLMLRIGMLYEIVRTEEAGLLVAGEHPRLRLRAADRQR